MAAFLPRSRERFKFAWEVEWVTRENAVNVTLIASPSKVGGMEPESSMVLLSNARKLFELSGSNVAVRLTSEATPRSVRPERKLASSKLTVCPGVTRRSSNVSAEKKDGTRAIDTFVCICWRKSVVISTGSGDNVKVPRLSGGSPLRLRVLPSYFSQESNREISIRTSEILVDCMG